MKEAVGEPFLLQNMIVPVAIVDPPSIIATTVNMLIDVPFTAGETTAPVANTRLANTGAIAVAGAYNLWWTYACDDATTRTIRLRRRNAADTGDIWSQRFVYGAQVPEIIFPFQMRVNVAAGEFFVVENVTAVAAGNVTQASIWLQGPL
jgi:hypothetical protein